MTLPDRKRSSRTAGPRARRALRLEFLEPRNLFASLPLGAHPVDTAEYMLGRVAVVPVLFESNGTIDNDTEDWTPESIQVAIDKVRQGVQWWSEALARLDTVHTLEFVIDDSFAINPVSTGYEPISRMSQEHELYVGEFLNAQGLAEAGSVQDAMRRFNHQARERLDTDWAFTIFIVNSQNDNLLDDGQFAVGGDFGSAFAYPGGLYVVSPSTRPASTIAHEVGHIFWARDEYPGAGSWTDRRGYYNAQNLNASDNPTTGFVQEPSIMRGGTALFQSYTSYYLPASTRAMIGWLDSDGDGVFDVLDVPLSLEGTGIYHASSGVFRFEGFATAVALPNKNSAGPQNDITLNRVDRIEYRLDGGVWQTAETIRRQASDVRFELPVAEFSTIEIRAIDDSTGVTSDIFGTDSVLPLLAGASFGGVALIGGGTGESETPPAVLAGVTATLVNPDGSPLFVGVIEPDDSGGKIQLPATDGVELFAIGQVLDGRVGSVTSASSTGSRGFGFYNSQASAWQNRWAPDKTLLIRFESPVGLVELDAIGVATFGRSSYGRLEAYDADGKLLTRYTTGELARGEVESMAVRDSGGRIASVRALGHAWTEAGFDNLRYGVSGRVTAGVDGVFRFTGIPEGDYRLYLEPERLIHQFTGSGDHVTLQEGVVSPIAATFERVRSPWHNPVNAFDVNGGSSVEPLDAILVINRIARGGSGVLRDPTDIKFFVDTNNDGMVTPLDAILVINEISRQNRAGQGESLEGEQSPADHRDAIFAAWQTDQRKEKPAGLWGPIDGFHDVPGTDAEI